MLPGPHKRANPGLATSLTGDPIHVLLVRAVPLCWVLTVISSGSFELLTSAVGRREQLGASTLLTNQGGVEAFLYA